MTTSPYLGYLSILADWTNLLFIIPGVIIAFWWHGVCNAYFLKKYHAFEDKKEKFSLNPLKYISIIGFLMMVAVGYGWCKTPKADYKHLSKKEKVLVNLAGPMGNLIMMLTTILIQGIILVIFLELGAEVSAFATIVLYFFDMLMWVNIIMFVTHILPVPGFNGYNIIKTLFFDNYYNKNLAKLEESGKWIFVVLALSSAFVYIAELPTRYIYSFFVGCQEWLVNAVTRGLYAGSLWAPKN